MRFVKVLSYNNMYIDSFIPSYRIITLYDTSTNLGPTINTLPLSLHRHPELI